MRLIAIFLTAAIGATSANAAEELHLICDGGGTVQDDAGRSRQYIGSTRIDIIGDAGRIRFPADFVPFFHGGSDGWFDLKKIVRTETEISARASVTFYEKPRVAINRLNGSILVQSSDGTFVGQCEPFDPAKAKQRF